MAEFSGDPQESLPLSGDRAFATVERAISRQWMQSIAISNAWQCLI
jgi:hypothetical protein